MTDLEKFVDLYNEFGIECKVNKISNNEYNILLCTDEYTFEDRATLSDMFDGYSGFYTSLVFDKNGKFITQGFYE